MFLGRRRRHVVSGPATLIFESPQGVDVVVPGLSGELLYADIEKLITSVDGKMDEMAKTYSTPVASGHGRRAAS